MWQIGLNIIVVESKEDSAITSVGVIVNSVCQTDWTTVPTYVVKRHSLSVRVFLDEINI